MTTRQLRVLRELACFGDWARPLDIGGGTRSHHSATLTQLVRLGYAERKDRGIAIHFSRASFLYRITAEGCGVLNHPP